MPDEFASPFGCRLLAERSSSAAELTASQETTKVPAATSIRSPLRSISAVVTVLPEESVVKRRTKARVQSSTFGLSRAGSTPHVSASLFACSLHGKASQVSQRMQVPPVRKSTPIGSGNGCSPCFRSAPASSAI